MGKVRVDISETSHTVLLLVDFVNPLDFDGAQDLAPSAVSAAKRTAQLRRRLAAHGVKCIYANDNYGMWTSDFDAVWRHCKARGGDSGAIVRALKPRKGDYTVLKPRHSAFYATPLDMLLKQLRCKKLIVTGIAADSCVFFTAMDAYLREYSLWIPVDCVAAESAQARDQALEQMARVLKADIRPSGPRTR
jgi:nicotinamidase-related amidase